MENQVENETTDVIVQKITDYLNRNYFADDSFCQRMSFEHRTLQQEFTRLCLNWIEYASSDAYRTDMRNEDSKKVCKLLMSLFREEQSKVWSGETLNQMSKPSAHLGHI